MRKSTKSLKNEMKKDICNITAVNNSKSNKRTPEQNEQSRHDKYKFYKENGNINLDMLKQPRKKNTV